MNDAQRKVRELFDAHFTISEIVERTALEIQTVVRLLNAPRVVKPRRANHNRSGAEAQSHGLSGD
jgi:DNA invertase Pin-like site-specific DNA recombinase